MPREKAARWLLPPGEALCLPQAIGVYCQAIWGLKDKLKLLSLTLGAPSSIFLLPPSTDILPSLLSVCLSIHLCIHTHNRAVSTSPRLLPILADLSFSGASLPGCPLYSSSQMNSCNFVFLHPKCLLSSIPEPGAGPGAYDKLSDFSLL